MQWRVGREIVSLSYLQIQITYLIWVSEQGTNRKRHLGEIVLVANTFFKSLSIDVNGIFYLRQKVLLLDLRSIKLPVSFSKITSQ